MLTTFQTACGMEWKRWNVAIWVAQFQHKWLELPLVLCNLLIRGAGEWNQTTDLRFTKPLLCQLSYAGHLARIEGRI